MTTDIRAVVFDWAGTMVDFGSRAPIGAFAQAFAERGVDLHEHEILADMGRAKREHIVRLLERPEVVGRPRPANRSLGHKMQKLGCDRPVGLSRRRQGKYSRVARFRYGHYGDHDTLNGVCLGQSKVRTQ